MVQAWPHGCAYVDLSKQSAVFHCDDLLSFVYLSLSPFSFASSCKPRDNDIELYIDEPDMAGMVSGSM